jgi:hypothetical protein
MLRNSHNLMGLVSQMILSDQATAEPRLVLAVGNTSAFHSTWTQSLTSTRFGCRKMVALMSRAMTFLSSGVTPVGGALCAMSLC